MPDAAARLARDRRHRAIFQSAVDFAIIAMDQEGRVTDWNPGAERVFGWVAGEMLGQPASLLFTPEDRAMDRPVTEMRLALEAGQASDERWHLRKDGSRFWASGEMMPLRDEEGAHLGFLKILRDRTPEQQGQEQRDILLRELDAERQRLRAVLDNAPVGIVFAEAPSGRVVGQNQRAGQIFGHEMLRTVSLEEHRNWVVLHPDGQPLKAAEYPLVRAISRGESSWGEEYLYQRPDGRQVWIQLTAAPVRDAAGRITGGVVTVDDIDARKQAEIALRRLTDTLEREVAERTRDRDRAWRLSQDVLAILDEKAVITAVNAAATKLMGWGAHELIGIPFPEITHPDDLEATLAVFEGIFREPLVEPYEFRLRSKEGRYLWFAWTGAFEDGKVYASGRHTTAEHEQAEALRQAEEALRQSQKMEAVGQLTGGIAHDFNNLLTGISGSLEMLQARIAQGRLSDLDRYVAAAQGAARRAASLTHRLLAFSRRQPLDPRPTDVNRLIAGMEELIRRTMGPGIVVEFVAAGGLWTTLVDPNQLENALLNLCINARDAMPDGGRLTIETANKWLDGRTGRERDLPPGQYISLCVTDTGTGMTPDVIARAFDPFFTTKPAGMGTGLGLSMVYGFARQSGGQVRIYSELGHGTTMCLYLPRHHGEAEELEQPAEPGRKPGAGQTETVLVVDDEPTVRMLVTEVLEELGYASIEAADGAAALRVLQSDVRIDLLITDVGLPGGMNGRQVADAGRAARPGLKVLFITGYAENAVVGNGHLEPGMQLLTKPFAMDALANRIRDLVSGP